MKRFVKLAVLLTIAAVLLVTAGCGGGTSTAQQPKVVNIGYTGPLSGGAALYGEQCLSGLQFAADQINAGGGISVGGQKYTIKVVSLDDKYLPSESATNAKRLVSEYHTPVILCPHSGGVEAMQQFNQQDNFLIAAFTSEPAVARAGNKLTFSIPTPYSIFAPSFAQKEIAAFGKKLAMLQTNSAYGVEWGKTVVAAWQKDGGTITINSPVDYNTQTDFSSYVSKALATKPDVVFVGGPSQPTAMVIKQIRHQGFQGGLMVMDQAQLEEIADLVGMPALEGTVGQCPFDLFPGSDQAAVQKFVDSYVAKFGTQYGKRVSWQQAWNYEAMMILAKAMEKAGTVADPAGIFAAFGQVLPLDKSIDLTGVKGLYPDGAWNQPGAGVFVQNGKYEYFPISWTSE